MAGKSHRNRNRGKLEKKGVDVENSVAAEGVAGETVPSSDSAEDSAGKVNGESVVKHEGDVPLYPVSVKSLSGDKLELQLSPKDSVMDVRQFLLDAPETCFFTCYNLILNNKEGSIHLEDYNEISEIADITSDHCSLEMVSAMYDDRSIRSHVSRSRELLSSANSHSSLSTSLAFQHENTQKNKSDKSEIPEVEGLGFMADGSVSLSNLVSPSLKDIKCVESLVFSSFNPPPSYRRLAGDLLYLDAVTLEGNKYCITGSTRGFFVNSSTGNILDSRPAKPALEATALISLLQKLSPKFKKGFREILEYKASAHPFENVQSLLPPNTWFGAYPIPEHKRDVARAEGAVALSFGTELIGMQRDWNEELQSCREFPHNSPQERILRDRALYKVTCDFVDAAISGAVGVINRCIPPINPTDPECFHMYVHNNIFFSFAVDADIGQISKSQSPGLWQVPKNLTVEKSSSSVMEKSCGSAGDDVADSSVETANMGDGEQATYASANNDLKGTKAYHEADVPGLYNLAMAIIDYRGYRVVAQSIIPGILQGDKSDSLLYGSVDNGKKICWDEKFHLKILEAAKHLHLKEHSVHDGSGKVVKLAAPVECKGIVGSDDRHYLLDLMRVTPRDSNYIGPRYRFCVLRPELINSFCQTEAEIRSKSESRNIDMLSAVEKSKSESIDGEVLAAEEKSNPETIDGEVLAAEEKLKPETIDGELLAVEKNSKPETTDGEVPPSEEKSCDDDASNGSKTYDEENRTKETSLPAERKLLPADEIVLNPNAFTEFKLAGSPEEIALDETCVKKAGSYLLDVVIPKFVKDLCNLEVSPMDGQTLSDALHAHGINIRYLGKMALLIKHLPHLWDLFTAEIIVRSTKHIFKDVLRESQDHELGHCLAHFFNCFFGMVSSAHSKGRSPNSSMKNQKKELAGHQLPHSSSRGKNWNDKKSVASYSQITSEGLWFWIHEFARTKYQFELLEDSRMQVKKLSMVRNLCQKMGVSIAARNYELNTETPFQTSDFLNLQPVVKHSVPVCSQARDLMESGKTRLAEGLLNEAYTLFSEAFLILQQVTGPMHREVANCCRYLAMVLYHAGDMAGAIMQQHKELIINERCLGLDHPDTAHSYGNMALFYHGLNQTELALQHMARTLLLLSLSSGPDHPDVAATFINVAMMYQDIGKMNTALRYLQEALKKNERLLGPDHIQTAVCYHALAIAFNCMGAYKLSLQHEKKTYDILVKQLGEDDPRTRDSDNWLKTFQMRDLQATAQKQKGQQGDTASAQKAIDILKAHPDLLQAVQAAAAGATNGGAGLVNKSINAAVLGEAIPRSRGVDQRAARAAAEVRKKAAARGLLVRPHGVPVNAMPPLSQLLNLVNSEDSKQPPVPPEAAVVAEELSNQESAATKKQDDGAPVGLGTGLQKKHKLKPKVVS